ncbi:MAG: Glyoxalase-like domain protein [Chloroflexi bacterium]|nr:Glyoxalase-like domain protein [Chloroflexota bacterium]
MVAARLWWPRPTPIILVPRTVVVCIDDVKRHYERARAAGAVIVRELNETDSGAVEYSARDLERNLWSFGTYRPEGSRP